MSLEHLEPKWVEINCDGETTPGSKYHGKFRIKPFLTHGEKTDAVRLAEKYCFGIETNYEQREFLYILAFLKNHIVEVDSAVKWWVNDGVGLYDESPIYALATELKKIQKKDEPKPAEEPAKEKKAK